MMASTKPCSQVLFTPSALNRVCHMVDAEEMKKQTPDSWPDLEEYYEIMIYSMHRS